MPDQMTAAAELVDHLAVKLARHNGPALAWRVRELATLAVRFFPRRHLRTVGVTKAEQPAQLRHAANLARARVRETWEARHGLEPSLWAHALAPVAGDAFEALADLWLTDAQNRRMISACQAELARRGRGA